jgi:hypothetical protein
MNIQENHADGVESSSEAWVFSSRSLSYASRAEVRPVFELARGDVGGSGHILDERCGPQRLSPFLALARGM